MNRKKCGFIALIGAPNAGKSTLVNRLVGAKVSIVTHKVQTTRSRLRGILVAGLKQLVLVDTPGIFTPRRRLDRAMVDSAWKEANDADGVVVLVDAAHAASDDIKHILSKLPGIKKPKLLAINKIDKLEKEALLGLVADLTEDVVFDDVFLISALNGDGVDDLRRKMLTMIPEGPWLYPEDQIADAPLRYSAAEITREKLYLRLHQELPYASTVETTGWKRLKDKSLRIEQTIYVERNSQKKIIIGKKGATIKAISQQSRQEIGELTGKTVHLFLFVKVREKWGDDPQRYREIGLEFPPAP
jgi:GTP-binding protein Era